MALQKRLGALEAALVERVEERIEERVEEELTSLLSLLEQHLSHEEFSKWPTYWLGDLARLKRRGRGKL